MTRVAAAIRATRSESGLLIEIPKTGLPTYDALRAYGAALALEALAAALRVMSFPRIRDQGMAYAAEIHGIDLGETRRKVSDLLPRSHPALVLLRSLGSPNPEQEARNLGELLERLLSDGELRGDRAVTLQAIVEPGAVKAPRGPSRAALQRRGEMLDQMRRADAEGVALAYLAVWGLARVPGRERWQPSLGLFATTRQDRDVVRILPLPSDMELRHERDPAAIADAWLWSGSEAGSACHHLVLLGLRGALGAHGALVDRLRPVQGGRWQPVSWGTVHAQAVHKLAASQDGYRALRAMREVFDRATRGDNAWEQAAHGLTGFLVSPGIDSLGRFLRATAGALADEGRGVRVDLDEKAMGEVMKVSDVALYQLYCEESVKQVGRSLRGLLRNSESWQVYEAFVAAREAADLAGAIHDLLREAATANRSAQRTEGRPVWVPGEDVLPDLLQLAERCGAEAVGLAVGSYALARPTRTQPVEEDEQESLTPEEVDS